MTNKEAILSNIPVDIPDAAIEKILIDRSLPGDGTYSAKNKKIVGLASADALVEAYKQASFNEGDLSVNVPRGALLREARRLYRENGERIKASSLVGGNIKGNTKSW